MKSYILEIVFWILTFLLSQAVARCPSGTFGRDCMFTCHCIDDADCDDISGHCVTGCAPGWSGSACQEKNAAYGRPTNQKNGSSSENASLAVDDVITTCSSSKADLPGWWSVELDEVTTIRIVVIKTSSTTDIKGWRVYAGMDENRMSMTLCTTIRVSGDGATLTCDETIAGKHVMVVNRQGPVVLCDFQVKVCSPQWFGLGCGRVCNCEDVEEVCDSLAGVCKTGCSAGWTGTDCYTPCKENWYGKDCKYECGNCADDIPCDHVTGTCEKGCKSGWTGMFCTHQCPADTHGPNCENICGHCYGIDACDVLNGNCMHGCEPGFTGRTCTEECSDGWYGSNCSQACGNCEGSKCDTKIGVCTNGCQIGWQGVFCSQECPKGFYGKNCGKKCMNCYQNVCNTVNGYCTLGCASGFTGHKCREVCPDNTFGINCTGMCGNCAEGEGRSCDATSGTCNYGCLPGYKQDECFETCDDGFYGLGCQKCGVCSPGTVCDPITGTCPEGCADSFFGELCKQSEPFSDEDGPQLAIFLGSMITIVTIIMILVTLCLVMIWRREYLPEIADCKVSDEKETALLDRNGFVFDGGEAQTVDI